ncbi:hypothetical protein [Nocardia alni]|uniref:aromatic-ring hydroxylase C-terminal domain-containing protein n=1 Tax=Nocardia alni TaxID=2815723 RepID=UPI0034D774A5
MTFRVHAVGRQDRDRARPRATAHLMDGWPPDGIVAWASDAGDDGLGQALARWFGGAGR